MPRSAEDDPGLARAAFLEQASAAWEAAATTAGGGEDHDFVLAGRCVRLRLAGDALVAPLTEALGHARVPDAPTETPDLVVRAWDTASTGVAMPPPAWPRTAFGPHGRVNGWFDESLQVTYHWAAGALSVLEPGAGEAWFWARSAEGVPFFERAAPLRTMLHGWLASRGLQLAHAAAVTGPSGCVLLAGRAGAGKSSTMLACLDSELGHLADDYCVLDDGDPPVAHALYSSVKAHPDALERLRVPARMVANPAREEGDKAVLFLHRHAPAALVARAPVRAVVVPSVTGDRDTRLMPASASEALSALAPSTMLQLPGGDAAALARLARAVRSVPCHRLEVGTDPAQVPAELSPLVA